MTEQHEPIKLQAFRLCDRATQDCYQGVEQPDKALYCEFRLGDWECNFIAEPSGIEVHCLHHDGEERNYRSHGAGLSPLTYVAQATAVVGVIATGLVEAPEDFRKFGFSPL